MNAGEFNLDSATDVPSINDKISAGMTPGLVGIFALVIVLYYYVFYSIGIQTGEVKAYKKSIGTMFLEIIVWGIFILLLAINVMQYYYDINIVTEIKDFFSGKPKINITVKQPVEEDEPEPAEEDEQQAEEPQTGGDDLQKLIDSQQKEINQLKQIINNIILKLNPNATK